MRVPKTQQEANLYGRYIDVTREGLESHLEEARKLGRLLSKEAGLNVFYFLQVPGESRLISVAILRPGEERRSPLCHQIKVVG